MFIGHFAVGFAGKKFAPRTNMGVLIAAPLLLDMLWPFFLLFGWEKVRIDPGNTRFTPLDLSYFPWSHSLLMAVVWATLFAGIYYLITRYRPGTVFVWVGVVSHWVLDWITHRPDMPLYPGSRLYGLGLWNSIAGTMIVEILMLAIGVWLYVSVTRARDRIGVYALIGYVVLLLFFYIGDRFGGPPESVAGDIIWPGIIAMGILVLWAWWFDRHRTIAKTQAS
ncbi:MAG: metal-dependent hydrolase [Candidatus Acidiferrales bacterium]